MLKLLAVALAAPFVVSAAEPVTPAAQFTPDAIVQVLCPVPGGYKAGTAFRIGGIMLSVNHVTSGVPCTINGQPMKVTWSSPDKDFSILATDGGPSIPIDCGGFIQGRRYIGRGFARGLPFQTSVRMIATGRKSGQFSVLMGIWTVVPGMSGGPIVDAETGRVVGTINVYSMEDGMSGSVALKDTPICASSNKA